MVVSGQVSHELEVEVSASQAWKLYGTLALAKLVEQTLTDVIHKIEVEQGDGEVGTILKLTFAPGVAGTGWQKEKFTAIDNEKRVKEVELIEEAAANASFASIDSFANIAQIAKNHLLKNKE
ncbi:hypothetical protein M0R45_037913 [Rubus argutus]|uniref:Bet v I/Major latex protein domain-containing protein n=1 Tax=Rubus argutus TaxID=59490 RepID=A0AAW1W1G6_RUBAR